MSALYRMATVDEARYQYDAQYHADVTVIRKAIERGTMLPVGQWFIERADGQKVAGPFETEADAHMARVWVEIAKNPETFWIRKEGGGGE